MDWTLRLDDQQLATVLNGLGELPAKTVFNVLNNIDRQIQEQRQAAAAPPRPGAT